MAVTSDKALRILVRSFISMAMQLPQEILAQIDQANADKETAEGSDALDATAGVQLAVATEQKAQAAAKALQDHRTASASGTAVINSLLAWFHLQTAPAADQGQSPQVLSGFSPTRKNRIHIP